MDSIPLKALSLSMLILLQASTLFCMERAIEQAPAAPVLSALGVEKIAQRAQQNEQTTTEQEELNKALFKAIEDKNVHSVKDCLKRGAPVDAREEDGFTPLINAVNQCSTEIVEILLSHRADPNARAHDYTPLMWAAENDEARIMQLLIKQGADINAQDECGDTALTLALKVDAIEAIELLLSNNDLIVDSVASNSMTSLHLAAQKDYSEQIIKCIIEIYQKQVARKSPYDRYELGDFLDRDDNEWKTALHYAAGLGMEAGENKSKIIQELTRHYPKLDSRDKTNEIPLHCAAHSGNPSGMEHLIKRDNFYTTIDSDNARLDAIGNLGTAAHIAVAHGHAAIIRKLKDLGQNLNHEDCHGKSLLHYAAEKGDARIVSCLIELEADIHLPKKRCHQRSCPCGANEEEGYSPSMYAAKQGNADAFKALAQASKPYWNNLTARDCSQEGPLNIAAKYGHFCIFECLKTCSDQKLIESNLRYASQHISSPKYTPLQYAVLSDCPAIIDFIAMINRDLLNIKDYRQATALHLAFEHGCIRAIQCLIRHGQSIKAVDKDNQTPVHYAAGKEKVDALRCSALSSEDINAQDKDLNTPLHHAVFNNKLDTCICLAEIGAELRTENHRKETPLPYVQKKFGLEGIVELFARHIYVLRKLLKEGKELPAEVANLIVSRYCYSLCYDYVISISTVEALQVFDTKSQKFHPFVNGAEEKVAVLYNDVMKLCASRTFQ